VESTLQVAPFPTLRLKATVADQPRTDASSIQAEEKLRLRVCPQASILRFGWLARLPVALDLSLLPSRLGE